MMMCPLVREPTAHHGSMCPVEMILSVRIASGIEAARPRHAFVARFTRARRRL